MVRFPFRRATLERTLWTVIVWFLFGLFVLGPLATVFAFSFTSSVLSGTGTFTLKWYGQLFSQPGLYGPLIRSFEIAVIVVVFQLMFGTIIAYSTVRAKIFGAKTLDTLSNITIAVPSVVVGLSLLSFYGPFGPFAAITQFLFGNPLSLTWTLWILVFAHMIETFPYMVRSMAAVLVKLDTHLESAARSLGASRLHVFLTITLPQLKPGLVAGSVLVLSRSIAEFGATIIVVSAVLKTAPIAIFTHREAGRGPLGLHLLEGPIEHQLGDVLRALSDERYRERFRSSDVRQGPAIFAERERDQRGLEGRLHQPRAEHQPVLSILGLRADDVRAVWNLLEDFLLHFLVHRPTGPPNDSVANQVMRTSRVGRPSAQIDPSTRFRTCMVFRVTSLLGSPGFSRPNGVGARFGGFPYQSATPPSASGWSASRFHRPSGRLFFRRRFSANLNRGSAPYPRAVMKSRPTSRS